MNIDAELETMKNQVHLGECYAKGGHREKAGQHFLMAMHAMRKVIENWDER